MNKKLSCIIIVLLIFLPVLFFTNCKSSQIPIPGQSTIVLNNVHNEYVKLGDSYFSIEKYNDAINCYKIALEDKKLYWPCYYKIAKCYVLLSDWSKSLTMFNTLLAKDPENSSLKASMAYIYSMSGDYKSALNCYKEILEKQPSDEKYIENYLAIMLSSKEIFIEYKEMFQEEFDLFKKSYPENSNISILQSKCDEFIEEIEKSEKETDVKNPDKDSITDTDNDKLSKNHN